MNNFVSGCTILYNFVCRMSWVSIGNGIEVYTNCLQTYPYMHSIRINGNVEDCVLSTNVPHGGKLNDEKQILMGYCILSGEAHYGQRCMIFGCYGLVK